MPVPRGGAITREAAPHRRGSAQSPKGTAARRQSPLHARWVSPSGVEPLGNRFNLKGVYLSENILSRSRSLGHKARRGKKGVGGGPDATTSLKTPGVKPRPRGSPTWPQPLKMYLLLAGAPCAPLPLSSVPPTQRFPPTPSSIRLAPASAPLAGSCRLHLEAGGSPKTLLPEGLPRDSEPMGPDVTGRQVLPSSQAVLLGFQGREPLSPRKSPSLRPLSSVKGWGPAVLCAPLGWP